MGSYLQTIIQLMKSLTCKQAEKWLEKVKESSAAAYKEIGKLLRRYDKNNDENEIFRKMNEVLLSLPELTEDFNIYLEEGTRFIVNPRNEAKINDFVRFVRKHRIDLLNRIIEMVNRLSSEYEDWSEMPYLEQGRLIKQNLRQIVKDDPKLNAYYEETFIFEPNEILSKLKLDHLANTNKPKVDEESAIEEAAQPQKKVKKDPPQPRREYETQKVKEANKNKVHPPYMMSVNEEKIIFKNLEKKIPSDLYDQVIKVIHLYHQSIITKDEIFELLKFIPAEDLEYMKDIAESREIDRRKYSVFRPLPDGDFHLLERATHSYVRMPSTYPNVCTERQKNQIAHDNLNGKWISVPRGTEESFNIRMKNSFESNMIKAEDERYEFDIFKKRLQVGNRVLLKIISQLEEDPNDDRYYRKMYEFINMNIVQTLYKNASKQQREEFENLLATETLHTLKVIQARVSALLGEMEENRRIHGLKIWNEVAQKNFFKSLDFKTNQFKRIEKLKCKASVFIDQLKAKTSYLESRGRKKAYRNPFEDKKDFFSVFNSFQSVSKKEKCCNRVMPTPKSYNVMAQQIPSTLPSIIFSFEDTKALELCYSFVAFYIDNTVVNETERFRCKSLARRIMTKFFQVKSLQSRTTSEKFNESVFFQMLDNKEITGIVEQWVTEKKSERSEKYERMFEREQKKENEKKRDWLIEYGADRYTFLPEKSDSNIVFYSSENFFVLLRFLYTLYERVIRMREVLVDDHKVIAFELLYFACIRSKESVRFEDGLSSLLGQSSYIFTTFYKLVEGVSKSLNAVATCSINSESILQYHPTNQADYYIRLNRFILTTPSLASGVKLVRCVFDIPTKLVYFNYIDSLYCSLEPNRELSRRRIEITQKIEYYAHMSIQAQEEEEQMIEGSRDKEKTPRAASSSQQIDGLTIRNDSQYCFDGNTIHMVTLPNGQDCLVNKKSSEPKLAEQQIYKNCKILSRMF